MYFAKKAMEPIEEEEIDIWACSNDNCSCWMRDNFSFEESPTCPLCQSEMSKSTRLLPVLQNHTRKSN